ncbi:MAG: hypothetical protein ABIH39_06065 [Candidatus Margulisiibacteriota bacterium]
MLNSKKKLLVLYFILFLFLANSAGAEKLSRKYIYKEQTGTDVNSVEMIFKETDTGSILKLLSRNEIWETNSATDNAARNITLTYTDSEDQISVTREDNYLLFSGMQNSKEIIKSVRIDSNGWYGSIFMFRGFVLSDLKQITAYMAVFNDQTAQKLVAIKGDIETITVNGKEYQAQKVKFTLPDWRSIFWASYYWFRVSDGVLVKTEETRGPPGTLETVMELITEDDI